jgi:hypothetical protein
MANQEVGRWECGKCGKTIVAAGLRTPKFKGFGAYAGKCPWDCGACVNRSFRSIKPGEVQAYRADEWDQGALTQHDASEAHSA